MGHTTLNQHGELHKKYSIQTKKSSTKQIKATATTPGTLVQQSFSSTPINSILNGNSVFSVVSTVVGVADINCTFSVSGSSGSTGSIGSTGSTGNDISLQIVKGTSPTWVVLSRSSIGSTVQDPHQISIFWSGSVNVGDVIQVVGFSATSTIPIYANSFKASAMIYSSP
jgi:hypothetical protein